MKILLLSPLPPPSGGIASWTKLYLQTTQAKKNEVSLINTAIIGRRAGQFNKYIIADEIKRQITILKQLKKCLKENLYDIAHLNTSCSKWGMVRDYLCGRRIKKNGAKLIVHCRCDVSYMVNSRVAHFFCKKLIALADEVITLNRSSQTFIKEQYDKKSVIIPQFISDNVINSSGNKDMKEIINTIVYVGRVTKQKGCDVIIKVAEHFPDISFILVGPLSKEIEGMKQCKNIVFTGELSKEEVMKQMKTADLFLFPTLTEGFPNALLEAMSCGLPIISTNAGAIPDMIEDKGGIIVEIGNVDGFIGAIKRLQADKKQRFAMSSWNREKVLSCYTQQRVMDMLFERYQEVVKVSDNRYE